MAQTIKFAGVCAKCGHKTMYAKEVTDRDIAPRVKSGLMPDYAVLRYTVTTDQMAVYLTELIHEFVPDAKVQVAPFYCERKRHKGDRHCSYASLKVALSGDKILKGYENGGWYGQIAEDAGSIQLVDSLFKFIVSKFNYDKRMISKWMNYKTLDQLEESFGITEEYLYDLRKFADPVAVKTNDGQTWVIFAVDPAAVIRDMLKDAKTKESTGIIHITDIRQVNKDLLEYTVNLCPTQAEVYEDPNVRTILTGVKDDD